MALDVAGVGFAQKAPEHAIERGPVQIKQQARSAEPDQQETPADIERALGEMEKVFLAFNTKLKFSINRDLNEVVVKVIDADTDKVIREIPPKELQTLHLRIKEALGLLFDKVI